MNLEQFLASPEYIFYGIVALCLVILTVCFVMLVASVRSTLRRVNKSLELVDDRIRQLQPVLDGVKELEDNLNEVITDAQVHLEGLQQNVSKVMAEVSDALAQLKNIEAVVDESLRKDVPPLLDETKELVSGVNEITSDIQQKIRATDQLFTAIDEAGQTVRMVTGIVKGGLTGLAVQLASLAVGMKTSIEYVTDNIHKGGDDK